MAVCLTRNGRVEKGKSQRHRKHVEPFEAPLRRRNTRGFLPDATPYDPFERALTARFVAQIVKTLSFGYPVVVTTTRERKPRSNGVKAPAPAICGDQMQTTGDHTYPMDSDTVRYAVI